MGGGDDDVGDRDAGRFAGASAGAVGEFARDGGEVVADDRDGGLAFGEDDGLGEQGIAAGLAEELGVTAGTAPAGGWRDVGGGEADPEAVGGRGCGGREGDGLEQQDTEECGEYEVL